jgi:dihydropyrimidinase
MGSTKGKLETGYDADVVIWDPDARRTISVNNHFQHCDSDIYEGFSVKGQPETVIVKGEVAFRTGK